MLASFTFALMTLLSSRYYVYTLYVPLGSGAVLVCSEE